MTKRLLEHPSNRFDEWVAILQRSQPWDCIQTTGEQTTPRQAWHPKPAKTGQAAKC